LVGFILGLSSTALVVAALVADVFVLLVLAANAAGQALLDPAGVCHGAGGRAAALILAGGPLLSFTPPLPTLAGIVGALLLGAGYLWAGYAIWAGQAAGAALQARRVGAAR
jgi:hypothetical protein